jgi:FixJ family two-component response regulator
MATSGKAALVVIVDDDGAVREALESVLRSAGFRVQCFASAEQFLDSPAWGAAACLLLDLRLPGIGGLELQERIARTGIRIPVVFETAHVDHGGATRLQAERVGALGFLRKPFTDDDLMRAVRSAVGQS